MSRELIEIARAWWTPPVDSDERHGLELADALEKALDRLEKAEAVCTDLDFSIRVHDSDVTVGTINALKAWRSAKGE